MGERMTALATVSTAIQAALMGSPGGMRRADLERIGWAHGNPRMVGRIVNGLLCDGLALERDGFVQWHTFSECVPGTGRGDEQSLSDCYRAGARILLDLAGGKKAAKKRRPVIRLRGKV
jgi:hypothetical protein